MMARWRPLRHLLFKLQWGIGAAIVVVLLIVFGHLDALEYWSLEHLFEWRGPRRPVTPIVIIAIDEASFR